MPRARYLEEGLRPLSDVSTNDEIEAPLMVANFVKQKEIFEAYQDRARLPQNLIDQRCDAMENKTRQLYLLPKVHKPRAEWLNGFPKGRSTVSKMGTEFDVASKWLTHHLQPLSALVRNTAEFLARVDEALKRMSAAEQATSYMVTADIESCYPTIPQDETITERRKWFIIRVLTWMFAIFKV